MSKRAEDQDALEAAVVEHLRRVGSKNWNVVLEQFPGVSQSRFWRTVKKFQGQHAALPPAVRKVLADTAKVEDHLPIPTRPTPATIMREGPVAVRANIDYLGEVNKALQAADMLRDYALNAEGKLKIPAFMRDSARLRLDAVRSAAAVMQYLTDVKRMEQFYDSVIEAVGAESPEVQRRIIDRLAELNKAHAMTPSAFL